MLTHTEKGTTTREREGRRKKERKKETNKINKQTSKRKKEEKKRREPIRTQKLWLLVMDIKAMVRLLAVTGVKGQG